MSNTKIRVTLNVMALLSESDRQTDIEGERTSERESRWVAEMKDGLLGVSNFIV